MVNESDGIKDKSNEINDSMEHINTKEIDQKGLKRQDDKTEVLDEDNLRRINDKPQITTLTTSLYAGPLPDPETFKKYEKVCPGAADRIITMAENQSAHRQAMENKFIDSRIKNSFLGLWMAFIIGIFIILCGVVCILLNHSTAGTIFSGIGVVSVISTFINNSKMSQEDKSDKKRIKKINNDENSQEE